MPDQEWNYVHAAGRAIAIARGACYDGAQPYIVCNPKAWRWMLLNIRTEDGQFATGPSGLMGFPVVLDESISDGEIEVRIKCEAQMEMVTHD